VSSLLFLFFFRGKVLNGIGEFLVVHDTIKKADIIYLLNGEIDTRPLQAIKLFKNGFANRIIIPQHKLSLTQNLGICPDPTSGAVKVLLMNGIDKSDIILLNFEGGVTSTKEEALALRHYIDENKLNNIIVVTSAFHTYRAKYIFNKELGETDVNIKFSPSLHLKFDATNWWKYEEGLITCTNEYLKLLYYFLS
jgi:uncharacterized SAM-binding protein YcdF (DUF218 family)